MNKNERKIAENEAIDITDYNNYEFNNKKIDFSKICAFLLIIIIFLILYFNGFFYKFKKITNNNFNEILKSDMLTEEEKTTILFESFSNNIEGKRIYQILK